MRVLVVDDSAAVRSRLVALLEEVPGVGLVREAACAQEALAVARELRPSLVLLDLHMPEGNGLEVLAALRRQSDWRPVIVVLTNDATEPYRSISLARGADHFCDKATDVERVLEILAGLLAAAEAQPGAARSP